MIARIMKALRLDLTTLVTTMTLIKRLIVI
jgi:hypothetical protein